MAASGDGSEVERLRLRAGLSRTDLAERAGIPLRSIYYYERDGRQPTLATRILLAAVLDCKPSDLRGGVDA